MGSNSICERLTKIKAYLAVISLQFGYSGLYIITSVCLKQGMNHFILSFYRFVVATLVITPFALMFERKSRPKMTISVFWKIILLGFLEPVLDQNMNYVGLNYTSATFVSALANILPAMTFIMATIFRLEKVDIRKIPSQAKVLGTILAIGGTLIMTLYKGPVVNIFGTNPAAEHVAMTGAANSSHHWIIGTLFLLGSGLVWTTFFILQSYTVKEYPSELSLTMWVCFMGALETGAVSLVMVRNIKAWALGWDSRLLAVVYTGVVCSGIAYYLQSVANRERGPVFVTIFNPLCTVITAALGYLIFHELLHLGRVIGAVIIMLGLYAVVWGKSKENNATTTSTTPNEKGKHYKELPIINDTTKNIITNNSNHINTFDDNSPTTTQDAQNHTTIV